MRRNGENSECKMYNVLRILIRLRCIIQNNDINNIHTLEKLRF